jgi:hypothetical protein
MDEWYEAPTGKQCCVFTQDDQDGSRRIRTTLIVMTEVLCEPDDLGKHITLTKPARSDISRFFADLSGKIIRALEGPPKGSVSDF